MATSIGYMEMGKRQARCKSHNPPTFFAGQFHFPRPLLITIQIMSLSPHTCHRSTLTLCPAGMHTIK
jgi:hypothetical protein